MAFPDASVTVLADFTGGDGTTPITGFSNIAGAVTELQSNAGTIVHGGTNGYNYVTASSIAQPLDVTAIIAHYGATGTQLSLLLIQNPGATWNGYWIVINKTGQTDVGRFDSGTRTNIGVVISQVPSVGDTYGVRLHLNGDFELYYKASGGSWASLGIMATDTTYTGSFAIGFFAVAPWNVPFSDDGEAIDDLSAGGNIVDVKDAGVTMGRHVRAHPSRKLAMRARLRRTSTQALLQQTFFRKTLSSMGTRTGTRQTHNTD